MCSAAQEIEESDLGLAALFRDNAGLVMDIALNIGFELAKSTLRAGNGWPGL
jgi:hypothetical protein